MAVDIKLNSVNFICDWTYKTTLQDEYCTCCERHYTNEYLTCTQKTPNIKSYGLVLGKCGHIAHLHCFNRQTRRNNNRGQNLRCNKCCVTKPDTFFEVDKNLETKHTQKIYKC